MCNLGDGNATQVPAHTSLQPTCRPISWTGGVQADSELAARVLPDSMQSQLVCLMSWSRVVVEQSSTPTLPDQTPPQAYHTEGVAAHAAPRENNQTCNEYAS